jgi:transposase
MSLGRPLPVLELTAEERRELSGFAASRSLPHSLVARAQLVLWAAEGIANTEIAERLNWSKPTVGKWRQRFVEHRLQGLYDELRPGRPRSVSDEQVAVLLRRTLKQKPPGATHWSVRLAAEANGLSKSTVHRVFQLFSLQPHRSKSFKLSTDPFFIEKVRDVVGLYLNPPDHAVVLSVDEKSQIQALDRTAPLLPMRPGQIERRTHDYARHGTTSLFAALDTKTGKVIGQNQQRHRSTEFRNFLDTIEKNVPGALDVHLILDNYRTHKTKLIQNWLAKRPRFHVHFTPTSASWLNLVERWFALLTERQLRRGVHRSTKELKAAIDTFIQDHNRDPKPFIWHKTADQILDSVARFCKRTSDSGR